MSINQEQAQYPSYQEFLAFAKKQDNTPSYTNLFSVHFAPPRILQEGLGVSVGGSKSARLNPGFGDLRTLLNFYANSVNLPSKQMTSGSFLSVGSAIKYATGTAYSQMNISFIMPRSQYIRSFFEEWTTRISPDSNQYVEFYDDYVCPSLTVFKYERSEGTAGGDLVSNDSSMSRVLRESGANELLARKYKIKAVWELRNVFPFNIGSVQLNNDTARAMTLTIGFLYERYRLTVEDDFRDPGTYEFPDQPFTNGIPQLNRYNSVIY